MTRRKWLVVLGGPGLVVVLFFAFLIGSLKLSQYRLQDIEPVSGAISGDLADVRGQIHVHCYRSHDSQGTIEEIIQAAKSAGVGWIILTDHNAETNYCQNVGGALLIFGSESNWLDRGSVLRYKEFSNLPSEFCAYGHIEKSCGGSGGCKVYKQVFYNWDAIEIINFHANVRRTDYQWRMFKALFLNPGCCYQELTRVMPENIQYWQILSEALGRPIPIFAATDAHANIKILGLTINSYDALFKLVSTHVFLDANAEISKDSIFQAIKKGRTYVAFDYLADPTGFQFIAKKGQERFLMGDAVTTTDELAVKIPLAQDSEIRIFKDNNLVLQRKNMKEIYIFNPEPGFWRTEVWRKGLPWIISGQILVK